MNLVLAQDCADHARGDYLMSDDPGSVSYESGMIALLHRLDRMETFIQLHILSVFYSKIRRVARPYYFWRLFLTEPEGVSATII